MTKVMSITGIDLSGSNGDSSRSITLTSADVSLTVISVLVQGASLHATLDYSVSGKVLTFLNPVYDVDVIQIVYVVDSPSVSSSETTYCNPLDLSLFMGLVGDTVDNGDDTVTELLGTGTGSKAVFPLDKKGVISGTYTFYYGASESAALAQTLTEDTHYSLDLTNSVLTLTSTGMTLVATNKLYGAYKYNTATITNQEIINSLVRAEKEIDTRCCTHFANASEDTPDFVQITNEEHLGQGMFQKTYFSKKRPLVNLSTNLSSNVSIGDTTLSVNSTNGFPSTGYLLLGTEKISYSGKTTTTFTGIETISTTHDSGDEIIPHIMEISTTEEGSNQTWTVLALNTGFNPKLSTGEFYIYNTPTGSTSVYGEYPINGVPNRVRLTYLYSESTIPQDIKRLCLMIASKDLMHKAVRKSTTSGLDEFDPSLIDVDESWINTTIDRYRQIPMGNT